MQLAIGLVASMTILVSVFHPLGDEGEADVAARWGVPDAARPSVRSAQPHDGLDGGEGGEGGESREHIDEDEEEEEEEEALQREAEDREVVDDAASNTGTPAKRMRVPRGRKEVIDADAPIDYAAIMKGVVLPNGDGWPEVREPPPSQAEGLCVRRCGWCD